MPDTSYRVLKALAKAILDFPTEEHRTIAKQVWNIIEKYGDITELAYSEDYGRMYSLLEELDAIPAESYQLIMIDLWLSELHKYYDQYVNSMCTVLSDALYGEFIDEVNFFVDREKKNFAKRPPKEEEKKPEENTQEA